MSRLIQPAFFTFLMMFAGVLLANSSAKAEKQPSLEELLTEYKNLGMPLPPDSAKLVRYSTGWGKFYSLGFLGAEENKKDLAVILCGTREIAIDYPAAPEEINPDLKSLKGLLDNPGIPGVDQFVTVEDYLPLAIQFHDRRWNMLAAHFLQLANKHDESPLKRRLVGHAWIYWKQKVATPKLDRAPVARRLHALILLDKNLDNEANRAFLKALDASLVPSNAKPGSVEALIDDLVDFGSESNVAFEQNSDRCSRVRKLGFEAVPALIQHFNDERLTRSYRPAWFFNNFVKPAHHVTIGVLAGELLAKIAGSRAAQEWEDPPTKDQVQRWWEMAKKIDEETYLLQNILPKENERGQPDPSLMNQIGLKYPKHLSSIFRTVLQKRHDLDTQDLAQAIMKSALPKEEKIELFSLAAGHKNYHHRCLSLSFLSQLDNRRFSKLLLAAIEGLPQDVDNDYWSCAEVRAANLITETDDPQVWQALENSAKRASVGLRMEFINLKHYVQLSPRTRTLAIRFLGNFLDDSTVRDATSNKDKFILCAGEKYQKIEVRNFAALRMTQIAGNDIPENPERAAIEWTNVRNKAMQALKLELPSDRKP